MERRGVGEQDCRQERTVGCSQGGRGGESARLKVEADCWRWARREGHYKHPWASESTQAWQSRDFGSGWGGVVQKGGGRRGSCVRDSRVGCGFERKATTTVGLKEPPQYSARLSPRLEIFSVSLSSFWFTAPLSSWPFLPLRTPTPHARLPLDLPSPFHPSTRR